MKKFIHTLLFAITLSSTSSLATQIKCDLTEVVDQGVFEQSHDFNLSEFPEITFSINSFGTHEVSIGPIDFSDHEQSIHPAHFSQITLFETASEIEGFSVTEVSTRKTYELTFQAFDGEYYKSQLDFDHQPVGIYSCEVL